MVFEAHSTDYQSAECLKWMVQDHFYVLKLGPWLTYALREGLYLLELMEKELHVHTPSLFRKTLLEVMQANPEYWQDYYFGSPEEVMFKLNFSYSDRTRYYLNHPKVIAAQQRLMENLSVGIPKGLLSLYCPSRHLFQSSRKRTQPQQPVQFVLDRVRLVLEHYFAAGT
jgi:D-tagatose-1,6-bisphosphate aldolase subunit GatZ/KbaZ